jgi:hypothetical protein
MPSSPFSKSRLSSTYREKWACVPHFLARSGRFSLQFRLHGGEGDIRTLSTGLKPARADVCVGYTESTV